MTKIGYIGGNATRAHRDALKRAGCYSIYVDPDRNARQTALNAVPFGGVLVIPTASALATSTVDLLAALQALTASNATCQSLDGTLTGHAAEIVDQLRPYVDLERQLRSKATREALDVRRAEGKTLGRPKILTDDKVTAVMRWREGGQDIGAIARRLSMSRATVYRSLKARSVAKSKGKP